MVEQEVKAKSALPTGQQHYFLFPPSVPERNVNSLGFVLIQKEWGFWNSESPPGREEDFFPHALIRKRFLIYKHYRGQVYRQDLRDMEGSQAVD